MSDNFSSWLALFAVPGLGETRIRNLVQRFGSPAEVLGLLLNSCGGCRGLK